EPRRGRGGGLRLLWPAHETVLGTVIRQTETDFTLVECFDNDHNTCRLNGYCRLKGALQQAMDSYLAVLDGLTLADLLEPMPPGAGVRKVVHLKHIPGLPDL
ncbi:MAG: Rrf2 family transcriptional regulator, partial [Hydrogenophaga sp.]|nr:Rrf2 family transcriptional regulator [Hydrogenophaga sp.]